jgi:hypothetical protein
VSDYPKFKPIPRRYRDITITEKIDGTNGLICIDANTSHGFIVAAGSRNRWLTLSDDNHGFARWVFDNEYTLINDLGEGMHYGEWWGSGINRGYGLAKGERRFSLFNTSRWTGASFQTPDLGAVPVLAESVENTDTHIGWALSTLRGAGSCAAPGFMNPEGIIIWHNQARFYEKVTLENDGIPKGQVTS